MICCKTLDYLLLGCAGPVSVSHTPCTQSSGLTFCVCLCPATTGLSYQSSYVTYSWTPCLCVCVSWYQRTVLLIVVLLCHIQFNTGVFVCVLVPADQSSYVTYSSTHPLCVCACVLADTSSLSYLLFAASDVLELII